MKLMTDDRPPDPWIMYHQGRDQLFEFDGHDVCNRWTWFWADGEYWCLNTVYLGDGVIDLEAMGLVLLGQLTGGCI